MYRISFEADTGILTSENSGFWTPEVARRYLDEMGREASQARVAAGCLRLLVDGRNASAVSSETAAVLADFESYVITSTDDRVAVIVGSSLAKMQTRRNFPSRQSEVFMSVYAARTWLCAYG